MIMELCALGGYCVKRYHYLIMSFLIIPTYSAVPLNNKMPMEKKKEISAPVIFF